MCQAARCAGLLVRCAPDSGLISAHTVVPIEELIGVTADVEQEAFALARKLLAEEPCFEDIPRLSVLEEVVIRELRDIFRCLRLDAWLQAHVRRCRFATAGSWYERLNKVRVAAGSTYDLVAEAAAAGRSAIGRHFQREGLSGGSFRKLLRGGVDRFAPCWSRLLSARWRHRPQLPPAGEWWFYSTAQTFSGIALAYEPYLPKPLHFLVEDDFTGGHPLQQRAREFWNVYSFSQPADVPRYREIGMAVRRIRDHLALVPLTGREAMARKLFLESAWLATFFARILPMTILESRALRRWLDATTPGLILVGNSAFERSLLYQAQMRGIPTVLLQHGVFGDYYQLMEEPVDAILARGNLFRDFLSEASRRKAVVLNVPYAAASEDVAGSRRDLLFLTAPYAAPDLHEADREEILRTLMEAAAAEQRTLIVRVHPLEPINFYQRLVQRLSRERGLHVNVEFSQGAGMEEVLLRSAAAVTYFSTVFVDCLRLGVPIVSFDWHEFPLKLLLQQHRVFHFARDLRDLSELARAGLRGGLVPNRNFREFQAPTTAVELRDFFAARLCSGARELAR